MDEDSYKEFYEQRMLVVLESAKALALARGKIADARTIQAKIKEQIKAIHEFRLEQYMKL